MTCETFIPDFSGDLYGTDPVVEFYAYLSPSKKFDTLDELKACIDHAARRAKAYFAKSIVKFFLAFSAQFCYTSHVTAARGWEYAHSGVPFSRILCRRQIKFYKEVLLL